MEIAYERTRTSFFSAAALSGLIGGAAFLMMEMLLISIFMGESIWGPPRMMAAIILGEGVLPSPGSPATFNAGIVMVAMLLHFALSITYAAIIDSVIRTRRASIALLVGAAAGLTIYVINFYGFTTVFPWFAMARNWISVVSHMAFGMIVAYSFVRIYHPRVE